MIFNVVLIAIDIALTIINFAGGNKGIAWATLIAAACLTVATVSQCIG